MYQTVVVSTFLDILLVKYMKLEDIYNDEPVHSKVLSKMTTDDERRGLFFSFIRQERNTLLDQTDKYTTIDYPHASDEAKQRWLDYRQALRDLPANTEDPENPVWPVPPE